MRGEIVGAEIGFYLHDFPDLFYAVESVDKLFAEQFFRDSDCVPVVK
jgi:hypothetical protein